MQDRPLMPKATAVWLVENTKISFKQIADFCALHELEVKGIADGDVAKGIKAYNPILAGQLTRESIDEINDILNIFVVRLQLQCQFQPSCTCTTDLPFSANKNGTFACNNHMILKILYIKPMKKQLRMSPSRLQAHLLSGPL